MRRLPTPLLTAAFTAMHGGLLLTALLGAGPVEAAGAPGLAAEGTDLLNTPACLSARRQFEALLAAGGPRDQLHAVRRQTALKCFGQEPASPSDARTPRTPVTMPQEPIRLRAESALGWAAPVSQVPATPPPLLPSAPRTNHCDATGCWDDQGRHYDRQGPLLLGPRGPCQQADAVLNCP